MEEQFQQQFEVVNRRLNELERAIGSKKLDAKVMSEKVQRDLDQWTDTIELQIQDIEAKFTEEIRRLEGGLTWPAKALEEARERLNSSFGETRSKSGINPASDSQSGKDQQICSSRSMLSVNRVSRQDLKLKPSDNNVFGTDKHPLTSPRYDS